MAHYAKVLNGIVKQVMVAEEDFMNNFVDTDPGQWIQTSYNTYGGEHQLGGTPLRKNFAGIGFSYDKQLDAFIPPKPYESWTLNNTTCLWEPPVSIPDDFQTVTYEWNETDQTWDTVDAD